MIAIAVCVLILVFYLIIVSVTDNNEFYEAMKKINEQKEKMNE